MTNREQFIPVTKESRRLNRYTTLPVLLDLLRRKKITLLDPLTWEDRNDAGIILEYKKRKKVIPNLFAICFGIDDETIHHWKAYADGVSGCCIEFDEKKLLKCFEGIPEIRMGDVVYKKMSEIKNNTIAVDDIPFTKRWAYRCESEFRILWEGETKLPAIDIDIDLNSINKITLSQKMPKPIHNSIKDLLRSEIKNPSSRINSSTLYENTAWIKKFKEV